MALVRTRFFRSQGSEDPDRPLSECSHLLQGKDSRALEAQVGLDVLGDLTHQALEGQLADQQLCGLLVAANLTESDGTGSVAVGLRRLNNAHTNHINNSMFACVMMMRIDSPPLSTVTTTTIKNGGTTSCRWP